jgi:hypothetical protein
MPLDHSTCGYRAGYVHSFVQVLLQGASDAVREHGCYGTVVNVNDACKS